MEYTQAGNLLSNAIGFLSDLPRIVSPTITLIASTSNQECAHLPEVRFVVAGLVFRREASISLVDLKCTVKTLHAASTQLAHLEQEESVSRRMAHDHTRRAERSTLTCLLWVLRILGADSPQLCPSTNVTKPNTIDVLVLEAARLWWTPVVRGRKMTMSLYSC